MKYTDYQKVYELAANILKDDKQMILLTNDLSNQLKTLEGSFLDDGIDEVRAYVQNLTSKLISAQSAFSTVATELAAFADLLRQGK